MSGFFLTDEIQEEVEFLKNFPTHDYKPPKSIDRFWVFWSQDHHREILQQQQSQGFQINSNDSFPAYVHTRSMRMISDKIKHAFFCGEYIIQFWAPVMTISGRRLLSTSGQPFAVSYPSKQLSIYRLRCMEYQFSINEHNDDDDDDPMILSDAPTATAFLNRFPELVLSKNLEGASPLVDSALECHLGCSFMLPICFLSQTTACCIGVLEFSTSSILFLETIISMIRRTLEEEGLGVFQIQERIPYKIIHGLKPARDEIEEALKIICESNNTPIAQVWIAFKHDNYVPFSSYLEGTRNKQMLSLKLTGCVDHTGSGVLAWIYDEYYRLCDMFPLEMGEDFVEKTLEDYKPRFCNDVSKLSGDTLVKQLFDDDEVSRLAICLNSIHSGDFCYAFEFIWGDLPDYDVKFVEELLLKLKELLPSFKLASGAELDDELDIIKVGDSTATETKFLKIFQGKRLSPIPAVLEEGRRIPVPAPVEANYTTALIPLSREVIEQQFGNTETEAAENLKVSRSTLRRKCRKLGILEWKGRNKRKVNDLYSNQSDTNEEDTVAIQKPLPLDRNKHTLTIEAEYAGDVIKFHLQIFQATFETVMEEIGTRLKLTPGTYKVKYLDEDKDWILVTCEQDISDSIKTSRNSDQTAVRLRVEPST